MNKQREVWRRRWRRGGKLVTLCGLFVFTSASLLLLVASVASFWFELELETYRFSAGPGPMMLRRSVWMGKGGICMEVGASNFPMAYSGGLDELQSMLKETAHQGWQWQGSVSGGPSYPATEKLPRPLGFQWLALNDGPGDKWAYAATVPAIVPVVVLGWWPALALRRNCVKRKRMQEARCVRCGYEMRGLPKPRCPECGEEVACG